MTKIISCLNLKGGCGKTSVCLNLAAALAGKTKRVIVLDLDPQQSATRWASMSQDGAEATGKGFIPGRDVTPLELPEEGPVAVFQEKVDEVTEAHAPDYILTDTPPELATPALVAALYSDLALIPTMPSPLDFWAAEKAVETAREARSERNDGKPKIALVPSRVVKNTVLAREISDLLTDLGERVAPPISQRVALVESVIAGQTIDEYANGSPGHEEFKRLARFVNKVVKNG